MDKLKSFDRKRGFNIFMTAGSPYGHKASDETRRKMSETQKRIAASRSPEEKAAFYANRKPPVSSGRPYKRKSPTAETREKIRAALKGRTLSQKTIDARISTLGKTYTLIDPNGQEVVVTNLSRFCQENGLISQSMHAVIQGRHSHYRGWRCKK